MTIPMPEPVAFRWRVPIVDSDGRQCGESDWKFGTEKGGLPWWTRDNLITTTQAEAYADARVREVLRSLLRDMNGHVRAAHSRFGETGKPYDEGRRIAYEQAAADIRALIPQR